MRVRSCIGATAALLVAACSPAGSTGQIGSPARGVKVILRGACGSCHVIPGVSLADGVVGPSLAGIGGRTILAGFLPNTPSNLAAWIRDPQRFAPGAAMPPDVLSDRDAADAAAYLETLPSQP